MRKILDKLPDLLIQFSFGTLFFLVPLILTPFNYELFEFNKMMLTYALTVIIACAWMTKIIVNKNIQFNRTPLDIPLILFLISQIISTVISLDTHVSLFGYYSRFNGGLLSTISYLILYFAFTSNFPKNKISQILTTILAGASLVSVYGILEHFGIDKEIWVQDVQNRVFSSLGQPNWLGAYLAVLIPITLGLGIISFINNHVIGKDKAQNSKIKDQKEKISLFNIGLFVYWLIGLLFFLTLVYTKSRSAVIALWVCLFLFFVFLVIKFAGRFIKPLVIFVFTFLFLHFIYGIPFIQLNKFTLPEIINSLSPTTDNRQPITDNKPTGGSVIEIGITESGTIRKIVWDGALDIFRHYPLTGSGVETFAFSYYQFRPAAHNMTSEWDFLYNKAHNEYLNFAATTGIFGLGSHLLIIIVFVLWSIKSFFRKIEIDAVEKILLAGMLTGWLTILITNFFGFSVVIIQLLFFLIPALSFVFAGNLKPLIISSSQTGKSEKTDATGRINTSQTVSILVVFCFLFYVLFSLLKLWYADTLFAKGYHFSRSGDYIASYQNLKKAIILNGTEPLYYDEMVIPIAQMALSLEEEKQSSVASELIDEAIAASNLAVSISPNNVNFLKTRTRLFFALSNLDNKYTGEALNSLEKAKALSPTDPKITYNLALIYDKFGRKADSYRELDLTTKLKPDYRDAYFAQALYYQRDRQKDKARSALNFILTRIATQDAEAKKKLEELK